MTAPGAPQGVTGTVERVSGTGRATGEIVGEQLFGAIVKDGRREADWRAFFTPRGGVSVFFWLFGMFLDDRHKPSMSRIMLALWTVVGYRMVAHELALVVGPNIARMGVPLGNAVWTAWWAAEGVLTFAVFGPGIASYFGPGATGSVVATAIGAGAREDLGKLAALVKSARAEASKVDGEGGTEYDK